jgi:hypothetical protein
MFTATNSQKSDYIAFMVQSSQKRIYNVFNLQISVLARESKYHSFDYIFRQNMRTLLRILSKRSNQQVLSSECKHDKTLNNYVEIMRILYNIWPFHERIQFLYDFSSSARQDQRTMCVILPIAGHTDRDRCTITILLPTSKLLQKNKTLLL